MRERIRQLVLSCGADVCGFGAIERFADAPDGFSPKDIYSGCRSIISFGIALPKGVAAASQRLVYSRFNGIVCDEIDRIALKAAKLIEREFVVTAVPVQCDTPYEYWDEDKVLGKGLLSMKHAAVRCGLGEIGKSGLLINSDYGNLLTLGAILTDLALESDELCSGLCIKGCTRCIDSCPVHAINSDEVVQKLCRENTYVKTSRGFDAVNCNKCRTVCPMKFGRKQ